LLKRDECVSLGLAIGILSIEDQKESCFSAIPQPIGTGSTSITYNNPRSSPNGVHRGFLQMVRGMVVDGMSVQGNPEGDKD